MRYVPLIAIAAASSLLAACASAPRSYGPATQYVCPNGFKAGAQFSIDGEAMNLTIDQKTSTLKRVVTASGARYSDGKLSFWEKGGEAIIGSSGELLGQSCRDLTKQENTLKTLSGTVNYSVRMALPPTAALEVKLQDVSRADAPALTLGEFKRDNAGQVPIPFALQYDTRQLEPNHTYVLQAAIRDGDRLLFVNDVRNEVFLNGADNQEPVEINVILVNR